jgi:hypothetical protein|tara:strand:- start:4508 stop:4759 length:252 start_codon:yes stop_codon:yes gene_type:complete
MADFNEHLCMEYSYQILTGRKTFEEILEEDVEDLVLMFNPHKKIRVMPDDIYDVLIDYYITLEEYEKCEEILEVKQLAKLLQE